MAAPTRGMGPASGRRATSVLSNSVANFIGGLIPALLSIAATPIYLSRLGVQAYALLGLAISLEQLTMLMDFGFSASINREVARNQAARRDPGHNRQLLRIFQMFYWPVGCLIALALIASSGWIAREWLHTEQLSVQEVQLSVIIIALFVLARWPLSLYAGVLRGLQLQVAQNTISVIATILRVGAGVAVAFIAPSTILFLLSQAIGGFIEVLALAVGAWWALGVGGGERSPFKAVVRGIWRFALSFNVIGFLSVVVIVSGQLIMSRFLPLVEVGFYSVAVSAASAVGYIPTAVAWAVFPRFSGLHETRALDELSETFRVSVRTTVFFGIGVALPVALFAHTLLLFWLRSPAVANGAAGATSLLALGYLMYAVWAVPQYLVISSGATRKPLLMTLVVVPTALVIETALIAEHGILVGGWTWLIVSAIFSATYGLLSVQLVPSAGIRGFWVRSVGPTVLAGLATFGGARVLAQALGVGNSIIPVILGGIAYALLGYRTLPVSVREAAMKPVSRILGRLPSVAGGP